MKKISKRHSLEVHLFVYEYDKNVPDRHSKAMDKFNALKNPSIRKYLTILRRMKIPFRYPEFNYPIIDFLIDNNKELLGVFKQQFSGYEKDK